MTTRIVLSHEDSNRMEEIALDKRSAEMVFDRATTNYHNTLNSIHASEKEFWNHIAESHNLDISVGRYIANYDLRERRFVVTEAKPTE